MQGSNQLPGQKIDVSQTYLVENYINRLMLLSDNFPQDHEVHPYIDAQISWANRLPVGTLIGFREDGEGGLIP